MARDGSGTYSLAATMAVANETASSTTVNAVMDDIAQALTDSINKDGTKAYAANQSMGGNKITSLAAATALTDAANLSQVQKGNAQQATTVAGTADAITLAFTPAITSYTTGQVIRWTSGGVNTVVAPTINVDSLGAKTVKKNPGAAALVAGDLGAAGTINEAVYNGTDFILLAAPAAPNATDAVRGFVELSTAAEFCDDTADKALTGAIVWDAAEAVTLTDAATIAVDLATGFNFTVTLGDNRTLGQPSNTKVGQSGFIRIVQDGGGSRTLGYHADWKFAGGTDPVLTTTASATDILFYQVIAANFIYATLVKGVA
jgi:plastocyanin